MLRKQVPSKARTGRPDGLSSSNSRVLLITACSTLVLFGLLEDFALAFSARKLDLAFRTTKNQHGHKTRLRHNYINWRKNELGQPSSSSSRFLASSLRVGSSAFGGGDGTNDNDEISKLIGKRNQIKKNISKKREEIPEPKINETVVDLDLDKLPEFRTERPVRGRKKDDDAKKVEDGKKEEKDGAGSKKKSELVIVDFKADYKDENDFHIPNRIGVSTVCWGDVTRNFVPSGKLSKRMVKAGLFVPGDVQLAYTKLLEGGITLFETAPSYGASARKEGLSAEDLLHICLEEQDDDLPEAKIAEGVGVSLWKKLPRYATSVAKSLSDSCERLGGTVNVELFQVPKSFLFPTSFITKALNEALETGYCAQVGVQGITNPSKLRKLVTKLDTTYGVALTSNAFEYSLTNAKHEKMINACKILNVIPLILNPLDGGLASGVYTATNPSGGQAGSSATKFSFSRLEKLQPLHSVQETVTERVRTRVRRELGDLQQRFRGKYGPPPKINTDITTTQIALNYIIAKGGVPLPEVNNPREAEEVLGCLGWTLTEEEVDMLDAAAALCKLR